MYLSLFRGRTDVYAKRVFSKKHNSAYYTPACGNEWNSMYCNKAKVKCKECQFRKLLPLTAEVINSHLCNKDENGHGIVGIYPLLPDDCCFFLAVDFDEATWQDDIAAFRKTADKLNVPINIERSRSGNGAHAWVFFADQIPAVTARRLGNILLTQAMTMRHEIRFSSYDRMFPNQDYMPNGGFGNLIALPLQGGARQKGNSEFVDEAFRSYPDQWAYLSTIRKMTTEDVNKVIATFAYEPELGILEQTSDAEVELNPWEVRKVETKLTIEDFPATITIVNANMLYIPKLGVSQRALNRIKRLAAFRNPDFYKKQKMRLSTYDTPRIIYSLHETKGYIGIPRGCNDSLIRLLDKAKLTYAFEDRRNKRETIKVDFLGELRPEQLVAFKALSKYENGILSLPTAFGKTVIGVALIAKRKCRTLIIVHLHTLETQWKRAIKEFLKIDRQTKENDIHIALVQSLFRDGEVDESVKDYDMVIVDECHHASSVSYEKILSTVNAGYVYGLTATPIRQDGQHPIVFMHCGAVRYAVDNKLQAERREFAHFIHPVFTDFEMPTTTNDADWHITQIYAHISESENRNNRLVSDVLSSVRAGRTPIILTQRKEHTAKLAELLSMETDIHIVVLTGSTSVKIRRETMTRLADIPDNEPLIVIATGRFAGEGFDYPRLDTLFLASPIAWKGTLAQYAGRLHRNYEGKTDVRIYDYVDEHVPELDRMYRKRLAAYKQMGYKIIIPFSESYSLFSNEYNL